MGKKPWTISPPEHGPQCDSLVWTERHWAASFFAKGRSWICEGCGYELWETVDDQGIHEIGERRATCPCCVHSKNQFFIGIPEARLSG